RRIARQVTAGAVVLRALLQPLLGRLGAAAVAVALEAAAAVEGDAAFGGDRRVRVVTGDAAELLLVAAALEATAEEHLFDVVERLGVAVGPVGDEDGEELVQRQAGAEVVTAAAVAEHANLAGEVALLTDRLAERGRELAWVDDGVIDRPAGRLPPGA